ncbi:MAG TPA: glycoside hydrolase family 43 protein [Alphaproteobacteria bacterium]|nr:glycoside hydrolase family 43 protein [Alphaproteobacteria bacterium]
MRRIGALLLAGCALALAFGAAANPVIDRDFPDPDLLLADGTVYAFATNVPGINVQAARSKDLKAWEALPDALPALPAWTKPGMTWAPEVSPHPSGQGYVLYYTAAHKDSGRQCIGMATGAAPAGPFVAPDDGPLICQTEEGGSIDPSLFRDEDGQHYLLWKNDGNCCGHDTWLYIQKVGPDARPTGTPTRLIRQDQDWEDLLVEAPTLWRQDGRYYLFYSANGYAGPDYAVGYAVADAPLGPYTKAEGPLLKTGREPRVLVGPGGQDVIRMPDGRLWFAYHSWNPAATHRGMHVDPLEWEAGRPKVAVGR